MITESLSTNKSARICYGLNEKGIEIKLYIQLYGKKKARRKLLTKYRKIQWYSCKKYKMKGKPETLLNHNI